MCALFSETVCDKSGYREISECTHFTVSDKHADKKNTKTTMERVDLVEMRTFLQNCGNLSSREN